MKLKEEILQFVREKRFVSFVEIEHKFGEGNTSLELEGKCIKNVILWLSLKKEVADAILELIREKRLFVIPTHWIIYVMDGKWPDLPIAKRLRRYKEPHWLPAVLDICPSRRSIKIR